MQMPGNAPVDPASFSDDTSLPHAGATVSIHAQILPGQPLDWFYTLLTRAPNHLGEPKSTLIVQVFFSLPAEERRTVLATLKSARIHISDPRPYIRSVDEALADVLHANVPGFIQQLDRAQQQNAEKARRKMIAEAMLDDAPPRQIGLRYRVWELESGTRYTTPVLPNRFLASEFLPYKPPEPPKRFDFAPFERRKKNVVNVVSPYLSKSQAVFGEAMDILDRAIASRDASPLLFSASLCRLLAASHAFDKGNTQQVAWIDGQRRDLMNRIDQHGLFDKEPGPLSELDSQESPLIRAADFAAGIAREVWYRNSLPHLTGTFDYVTYNGKRLSETDAGVIEADLARKA